MSTTDPCPTDFTAYGGSYQGAPLQLSMSPTQQPCGWPPLIIEDSTQLDPQNPSVELHDPINAVSVQMTLPPEMAQQRALSSATGSDVLCSGQTFDAIWTPASDLASSTSPMNVRFAYRNPTCIGGDCPVQGFEASATIGSDIKITVPTGLDFSPSDVGELIVAPSGAAGNGELSDCEGAISCTYQLTNLRAISASYDSCGSGSGSG